MYHQMLQKLNVNLSTLTILVKINVIYQWIKIDGFPTIILIKNKVPKKFEGKNDFDAINKFINE